MGCIFDTIQVKGKPIEMDAYVLDEIGCDDDGRPIDILLGAPAMQKWGIRLIPEEQRLDLSRYLGEFSGFPRLDSAAAENQYHERGWRPCEG